MIPGFAPFLAAIKAAPDDDSPRLVCADWLEEHGEAERASMIRGHVQRRIGPLTMIAGSAMTLAYSKEIDFYVMAGGVGSVVVAPAIPRVSWTVTRGFVSAVTCPAVDWLAHADSILAEHPVREVRLTTEPMVLPANEGFVLRGDPDRQQIPDAVLDAVYPPDTLAHVCLRYRWPCIAFHLPKPKVTRLVNIPNELLQGFDVEDMIRRDMAVSLDRRAAEIEAKAIEIAIEGNGSHVPSGVIDSERSTIKGRVVPPSRSRSTRAMRYRAWGAQPR